ncbi:HNH endonuclease family protein [Nocardioides zeae]|uniref:HNH endonuclease family protein n=1 Tax=Nocardioides imazamoxiresistens TaxID=3231893 RepID=A0ABU3PXQ8_9ACTN|nr:HNH endonuclease family protein [Nocardioides zeae]MDT9593959.1 HNH endonuclease family protein [Nocardioides zeae]
MRDTTARLGARRTTPTPTGTVLARVLTALALALVGLVLVQPPAAHAATYSAPIAQAVADLPVATESRTGYDRDLFEHWVDADGDGCATRAEVLIEEAEDAPSVGSGCSISGGRWFSYYDATSYSSASDLDIDHMVPLAEAWDSGASGWSAGKREAYANDLDFYGSLIAVSASTNRSKSDQDPAEWMPPAGYACRYVTEWVSVKHRWGLSVDSAEKSALASVAAGCTTTVSVPVY